MPFLFGLVTSYKYIVAQRVTPITFECIDVQCQMKSELDQIEKIRRMEKKRRELIIAF